MQPASTVARSVAKSGGDRSSPTRKINRWVPLSSCGLKRPGTIIRAGTERRTAVGGEIAKAIADRVDRNGNNELDVKVTMEMIEATRDYEKRAALIRAFVRQDPARAALVVRDLIRHDTGAERNG